MQPPRRRPMEAKSGSIPCRFRRPPGRRFSSVYAPADQIDWPFVVPGPLEFSFGWY